MIFLPHRCHYKFPSTISSPKSVIVITEIWNWKYRYPKLKRNLFVSRSRCVHVFLEDSGATWRMVARTILLSKTRWRCRIAKLTSHEHTDKSDSDSIIYFPLVFNSKMRITVHAWTMPSVESSFARSIRSNSNSGACVIAKMWLHFSSSVTISYVTNFYTCYAIPCHFGT